MYTSFNTHTHFSLLYSSARASQLAERCEILGYDSCAMTDFSNISGAVDFYDAMKAKNKKPIFGCVFSTPEHRKITLIAKNLAGWKQLVRLVSYSNNKENYINYNPTLSLEMIMEAGKTKNLIAIVGYHGSILNLALDPEKQIHELEMSYGKDSVCIAVDRSMASKNSINNSLHSLSDNCIASHPVYYSSQDDVTIHRALLASNAKTTIKNIYSSMNKGSVEWYNEFFRSNNFYLPSLDEMKGFGYTTGEIEKTKHISDMCESYSISNRPSLPKFNCPDNMSEPEYLRHLCKKGWEKLAESSWDRQLYGDRIKKELSVIHEASLDGYFLIVQDFVKFGYDQGWLMGPGRGSAAGAMVSYLTGITTINPIPYDLLFERFYNAGRNTKDKVSYPDVDVDVPVHKRQELIQYIKDKYGNDRVCHIATYSSLQGKGAIKEVLRVNDVCDTKEIDFITSHIPPEFQIADALEEAQETSVLKWLLENEPKTLADWVHMNDDGTLGGQYAEYFRQAIDLEGVYKNRGKHPSGIIISPTILDETCPMVWDSKSEEKIAGFSMNHLETVGLVKFDVLGLLALDKLMGVRNLVSYGRVE